MITKYDQVRTFDGQLRDLPAPPSPQPAAHPLPRLPDPPKIWCENNFYKSLGSFHTMKTNEALAFSSEALLPQVFLISCLDSRLWIMGTTFFHDKNYFLS